MNNSAFDKRVHNWQEKLFKDVPRADEEDPQWDHLRAKKFVSRGTPGAPSVEIKSFQPLPVKEPEPVPEPVPEPEVKVPVPVPEPEVKEPAPEPAPEIPVQQAPPPAAVENTPFTQGTVLSEEAGDTVLEPGGTFTFGDD